MGEVTAENLTDEQIRHFLALVIASLASTERREWQAVCRSALNPSCHVERKSEARRRIAEAINAHREGSK